MIPFVYLTLALREQRCFKRVPMSFLRLTTAAPAAAALLLLLLLVVPAEKDAHLNALGNSQDKRSNKF